MMIVVPRQFRGTHYLACVIQSTSERAITAQGTQVSHDAVFPDESMLNQTASLILGIVQQRGGPYNLSRIIDGISLTTTSSQRAEVSHHSVLPDESVSINIANYICVTY